MDDLRPLTFYLPEPLPLFADDPTVDAIERVFDYTFRPATRAAPPSPASASIASPHPKKKSNSSEPPSAASPSTTAS